MSKEMWEFDEDGELFFEKCIHGFLPELFSKWKALGTNHVVSIVLFAKVLYPDLPEPRGIDSSLTTSSQGYPCRDFYKVVIDWETRADWSIILTRLKNEFVQFQRDVLQRQVDGITQLSGSISPANEGNILEAINLALNPFDKHYIDRDLLRTGLSIVIITPGTGFFEVDRELLRLTTQRMIDNGIGLDLVCLSQPPLYAVPLFQYQSRPPRLYLEGNSTADSSSPRTTHFERKPKSSDRSLELWDPLNCNIDDGDDKDTTFYLLPNWVDCSFWDRPQPPFYNLNTSSSKHFQPRCKMYEVQMMGVMDGVWSSVRLPYLSQPIIYSQKAANSSSGGGGGGGKSISHSDHETQSRPLWLTYDETVFSRQPSFISQSSILSEYDFTKARSQTSTIAKSHGSNRTSEHMDGGNPVRRATFHVGSNDGIYADVNRDRESGHQRYSSSLGWTDYLSAPNMKSQILRRAGPEGGPKVSSSPSLNESLSLKVPSGEHVGPESGLYIVIILSILYIYFFIICLLMLMKEI